MGICLLIKTFKHSLPTFQICRRGHQPINLPFYLPLVKHMKLFVAKTISIEREMSSRNQFSLIAGQFIDESSALARPLLKQKKVVREKLEQIIEESVRPEKKCKMSICVCLKQLSFLPLKIHKLLAAKYFAQHKIQKSKLPVSRNFFCAKILF